MKEGTGGSNSAGVGYEEPQGLSGMADLPEARDNADRVVWA